MTPRTICSVVAAMLTCAGGAAALAVPLESAFTYQGSLRENGVAVTGTADFEFTLWDAPAGGNQIGSTVAANGVRIEDGLFDVGIDFGAEAFDGEARWLGISLRSPAGSGSFVALGARQPLSATPYALQTRGIFVDDDQNIGIGTTNPLAKLTIEQNGGTNLLSVRQTDSTNVFGAVNVQHTGPGPGVLSSNLGDGTGGDFRSFGPSGNALRALNQGGGMAGLFEINNAGNSETALFVTTNGSGSAGEFVVTDPASGTPALHARHQGLGPAAMFEGDVEIGGGGTTGRLIVDGPGNAAAITANSSWYAIRGTHDSTSGSFPGVWGDTDSVSSNANGVRGYVNSTSPGSGSSGVRGINNGTNNNGYGVHGSHAGGGYGVYGTSVTGRGLYGATSAGSGTTYGVYGLSPSTTGNGVFGWATSASGINYGVHGISNSDTIGSAGVNGYSNDGMGVQGGSITFRGVYGSSITGNGVYGVSSSSRGVLGYATGSGVNYGVRGFTNSGSGYGVYADGTFAATGAKLFIQPDPGDPSREIRFVCLEGNESGTYFRGTTRLENGRAYIEVPEEFRVVSEPTDLTVQVTARGPDAGLWVESRDLNTIVVAGNGDVEFDYFVNGIRRGFKDFRIINENRAFVPEIRGIAYGSQYPPEFRDLLVESGILNADFTPNEETARRLGWELRDPTEEDLRHASGRPVVLK